MAFTFGGGGAKTTGSFTFGAAAPAAATAPAAAAAPAAGVGFGVGAAATTAAAPAAAAFGAFGQAAAPNPAAGAFGATPAAAGAAAPAPAAAGFAFGVKAGAPAVAGFGGGAAAAPAAGAGAPVAPAFGAVVALAPAIQGGGGGGGGPSGDIPVKQLLDNWKRKKAEHARAWQMGVKQTQQNFEDLHELEVRIGGIAFRRRVLKESMTSLDQHLKGLATYHDKLEEKLVRMEKTLASRRRQAPIGGSGYGGVYGGVQPNQQRRGVYDLAVDLNEQLREMDVELDRLVRDLNAQHDRRSSGSASQDSMVENAVAVLNHHYHALEWVDRKSEALALRTQALQQQRALQAAAPGGGGR
jgi:hypothetical protein